MTFEVRKISGLNLYCIKNINEGLIIVVSREKEELDKICDSLNNVLTEFKQSSDKIVELKKCKNCAHSQIWEGDILRRCSYYHDGLCDKVLRFCKYEHFMDKQDGLSLYSFKSWLNRLDKEEMNFPLSVHYGRNTELIPLLIMEMVNADGVKWSIFCKHKDEQ